MCDKFLCEEDLDLTNPGDEEYYAYWNAWREQAQATNDADAHLYSHGVFQREPEVARTPNAKPSPGGRGD